MIDKIQNDLNNLTKTELIELLDNAKKYIKIIEAKIEEPDEFRFNYSKQSTWYVGSHNMKSPYSARESFAEKLNINRINNGFYRMNNLKALKASDNIFNNNIIDAIAEQLEPNWEPDFDDLKQEKCCISFDTNKNVYTVLVFYTEFPVGIAVMSLSTANTIKKMLNDRKIKLYFEGRKDEIKSN